MLLTVGKIDPAKCETSKGGNMYILHVLTKKTPTEELHIWIPKKMVYGGTIKLEESWVFCYCLRDKVNGKYETIQRGNDMTAQTVKDWLSA